MAKRRLPHCWLLYSHRNVQRSFKEQGVVFLDWTPQHPESFPHRVLRGWALEPLPARGLRGRARPGHGLGGGTQVAGGEAARTEQLGREVPLHLGEWEQGTPARVCGSGARAGAGGGLHVIEPELLLHVAGRHLPEGRLVVLHELEDGRQLFLLNSVEERGERGERCSRSRPRGTQSAPRGGDPGAWLLRFPESAENQSRTRAFSGRELVGFEKLNSRRLERGVLCLGFNLGIWGPP